MMIMASPLFDLGGQVVYMYIGLMWQIYIVNHEAVVKYSVKERNYMNSCCSG